MNKEQLKKIETMFDYLQDKVADCYKEETKIAIKRFMEEV